MKVCVSKSESVSESKKKVRQVLQMLLLVLF